jgi:hypothetical protein
MDEGIAPWGEEELRKKMNSAKSRFRIVYRSTAESHKHDF